MLICYIVGRENNYRYGLSKLRDEIALVNGPKQENMILSETALTVRICPGGSRSSGNMFFS
jgi:hypothetical protein